jgi:hypothetical protein
MKIAASAYLRGVGLGRLSFEADQLGALPLFRRGGPRPPPSLSFSHQPFAGTMAYSLNSYG